jgi:tRNA A37 threonylcarbamoyladenosine modification protein TsaB
MHDVVVIALASPLLVGIYKEGVLVESIELEEKSSEALPQLFETLLRRYEIANFVYAKGPGSFMAIKVSYIFLKTLSIVKNITFLATDAFYFNENRPIKAVGKLHFVKISGKIKTQVFEEVHEAAFALPRILRIEDFSADTSPYYGIGAVG